MRLVVIQIVVALLLMLRIGESKEFRVLSASEFPKIGMFAMANQILGQLYFLENETISGLVVDFDTNGLYYDPHYGPNWWNYYFEPIHIGAQNNLTMQYVSKEQYFEAFRAWRKISRNDAALIVKKYIRIRPEITEKVEMFCRQYFSRFFILGVHYRGTDKKKEAPRVPYETVFQAISTHLPENQPYQIFVATDEEPFLEAIRIKFPGSILAIDASRSVGKMGMHFSKKNQYEIGEAALIDSLLLSKCDLLIRTSSNLSLWATYFNSALPVVLLNQNYRSHENMESQ